MRSVLSGMTALLLLASPALAESTHGIVLKREKVLALNAQDLGKTPALLDGGECYPRVGDEVAHIHSFDNWVVIRLTSDESASKRGFCPNSTLYVVTMENFIHMVEGYCARENYRVANPPPGQQECYPGPFIILRRGHDDDSPTCLVCPPPPPHILHKPY